ncbi:MAG: GNAT family N-acetyltransferase [Desulforegulaceae bacterium]|nr:GNAT family N-acetyltransferase [Desulforegulaceae bacterium]
MQISSLEWYKKRYFFSKKTMKIVAFDIENSSVKFVKEYVLKNGKVLKSYIINELDNDLISKFENAFSKMDFSPPFNIKDINTRLSQGYFFSVGMIDENIVGWTWGGVKKVYFDDFFTYINLEPENAFSFNSYVEKKYRGHDILKILIWNLVFSLKEQDYKKIWALIYPWNKSSIKAYINSGWTQDNSYLFINILGLKFHKPYKRKLKE